MRHCSGKEPGGVATLLGSLHHNSQGAHALGMKRAVVMREHLPNLDIAVAPTDGRRAMIDLCYKIRLGVFNAAIPNLDERSTMHPWVKRSAPAVSR